MSYYDILGVSKSATDKEIRQAYRKLARQYHPDVNPGDEDAEGRFKRINEAYQTLSDAESRKKYDRYGDNWKQAEQFEAQRGGRYDGPFEWTYRSDLGFDPLSDLLRQSGNFGRRRSSAPAAREVRVTVTLEEAFTGAKRRVTVSANGQERRIEVDIPPGVATGSVVRISLDKDTKLLLNVTVSPHAQFQRKGSDLYTEIEAPLEDVILGSETDVRTMTGRVRLKIPSQSQNGQKIRLAGQGMPKLGDETRKGDLYITIRPTLPTDLSDEERELFQRYRELRSARG